MTDGNKSYNRANSSTKSDNYIVVDIEIIPEQIDDDSIKEYLMDKNFPRKMHPMFSRVVMIGLKTPDNKTELIYPKDEVELLTRFWRRLSEIKPSVVVTFNGYNFDIPFLKIRSLIKGVKPSMDINLNKWKMENSNHFDCMQLLSASQTFLNVALEVSCKLFEIAVPEGRVSGEAVPRLYETGEFDAIKEHCHQDVELTEQLFLRLRN
jgi:DNA polymerase elongation subunit (family B)